MRPRTVLALGLAGLLLVAGCSSPDARPSAGTRTADSGGESGGAAPAAADVVTGLTTPWDLQPLRDGTFLVSERDTGKILRVSGSTATELTTVPGVVAGGNNEGGLLGLAMSRNERAVFAYYTSATDNRIVGMTWDGSTLGQPRLLFVGIPKGHRHNGGGLTVGPDGYLYVGTGEAGNPELAQDKQSLGGKILRLRGDGRPAPDNPYGNAVWSWGHRNVQGLAFDDQGRLWASEFGEQDWDELNLITRGANYGWPLVEGTGAVEGLTNPKVVWPTSQASPSGLAYWRGALWMAALRGQRLWQIPVQGSSAEQPTAYLVGNYGRLRSVAVATDGKSLLLGTSNTDGRGNAKAGDDKILRVTVG